MPRGNDRLWTAVRLGALFAGAVLVYLWPLTLRPLQVAYPPNSDFTDLLVSHLPNAAYARHVLWDYGQWPLWNAQLFGGQPFAADPLAGVWYPPAWLLLVPGLPLPLAFNLLLALHLAWGGLGTYTLLRREGVARGPALLGGLVFAGAPKVVAHLGAGHVGLVFAVAWTPWLLSAVRGLVERGGLRRGAVAGACLALVFVADVRWAYYAGLSAVAYGAWAWLAPRQGEGRGRVRGQPLALGVLAFAAFAALLSAALALPLAEFIQHSNRAALTLDEAAVFSLPPVSLLGLLIRNVGGFHEHITYAGTLPLLLALVGIGRRSLFWCGLVVLAAAFALGTNFVVFPLAFRLLPGLSLLRVPPRAWFLVALGVCVLAGHGAQTLTRTWWPSLARRYAKVGVRLPAVSTALLVMGVATVLDLARFNGSLLEMRPLPAHTAAANWLLAQPGPFRVYSPSYSLPAGDGLEHVDGVDPLQLASTVAFLEPAMGVRAKGYSVTVPAFDDGQPAVANRAAVPNAEMLGLLNVRYVAAEFPIAAPGLTQVAQFDTTYVYANAEWRPRVWMEGAGFAEVVAWTPNWIQVGASGPGRLVLSEIAYPGWRARINRVPAPLLTEHGLLRAVDVPALALQGGAHAVDFIYQPPSAYAGAALTVLGVIALAFVTWRERRAA